MVCILPLLQQVINPTFPTTGLFLVVSAWRALSSVRSKDAKHRGNASKAWHGKMDWGNEEVGRTGEE